MFCLIHFADADSAGSVIPQGEVIRFHYQGFGEL